MQTHTELFGWGDNTFGQLGLGDSSATTYKTPQAYSFRTEISALSCGEYHSLCLSSTGFLYVP